MSVIGFTGAVYLEGYAIVGHTVLGLMLGLSALYFVAGRVRSLNTLTFPDLIARVSGYESARPVAGSVLLLNGFLYLIMQLVGASLLVTAITGIPYGLAVWILGVVFIIYTVLGGMVSVAWTDLVQGTVMIGGAAPSARLPGLGPGRITGINTSLAAADPAFVDPTSGGKYTIVAIAASFFAFLGRFLPSRTC